MMRRELGLRRWPEIEAENLFAVDAADRLLLDEAAGDLSAALAGEVVVIGDGFGALTLGAIDGFGLGDIRVHQDRLLGQRALEANAGSLGLAGYRQLQLGPELLANARVVLLRLPRSLEALDEIAALIALHAHPDVIVFGAGRIKHLSTAMNDVLRRHFGRLDVSHARQKSRVLIVRQPLTAPAGNNELAFPRRQFHEDPGLWVCAHGGAFAGTRIDIGTRFLLGFCPQMKPDAASAIDLGCGTGVLAAALLLQRPTLNLMASDQSAAAVASAVATAAANGVADRMTVVRDIGLASQEAGSTDLVLLNPPFHLESTVHAGEALRLFADAHRVLRPGGELWTVFNSHLGYRGALERIVGPTRQAGRNAKFTVTVSTKL